MRNLRISTAAHILVLGGLAASLLVLAAVVVPAWAASADTVTVTANDDSGTGSLRQAVADAQPGDTIAFSPGLSGTTISLTSGEIHLNQPVTIDAGGTVRTMKTSPAANPSRHRRRERRGILAA